MMAREVLSDEQWSRIRPLLPAPRHRVGRPYETEHRVTVEGILWIARTGAPWRDLPERFGKWISIYQRFRRWTQAGVFERLMATIEADLDFDVIMVDGTFVKAHQHAAGAPKGDARRRIPALLRRWVFRVAGLPPNWSR